MIVAKDFNLDYTFESGQPITFYGDYNRSKGLLSYVTSCGRFEISAKLSGHVTKIDAHYHGRERLSAKDVEDEVRRRLSIEDRMQSIYARIDTDAFMHSAINKYYGMRITSNDPWEASLSFVVSQFNNIKRIRGIMKRLIAKFGIKFACEGSECSLFPEASRIANASLSDLDACGAGFRSKYIRGIAREFVENGSLRSIQDMDYASAKEALMSFDGIGDKVADCILLMGYRKLEAFPIDTWVKRVLEHAYFGGDRKKIKELHEFAWAKWDNLRGYAQQYIFWYGKNIYGR
ncbi:MAG: hypothetical protein QW774_03345 [Candidatus Micrarchaeaceae archaeon]